MRVNRYAVWLVLTFAANVWAGESGWTESASVLSLEANQQGRFVFYLDLDKNVSGCRSVNGFYADYGRAGSDLMYKTVLDALQHELKIQVYVTGGCDLNQNSAISSLRMLP